jgi:hypothetical protein
MLITTSQTNYKINPLIKGVMDENNPLMLEVLNRLIFMKSHHHRVFISQSTLAAIFDVTREYINKILAMWRDLGVISYRQMGFNRCCEYFFNPILFHERERLKWKLSALKLIMHVSFLFISVLGEEFTLNNIRNIYSNKYQVVTIRNEGYDWYEAGYGETSNHLFINNPSITIDERELCPKEDVMNQQSIITVIAQAYNLSIEQQEQLSRYSFEALEYARKELYRQNKQRSLTNPTSATSWFSAVASSFEKKAAGFPKTGRMGTFAKKIVNAATNANHSPSSGKDDNNPDDPLHMTMEERVNFAQEQIEFFDGVLNEGDSFLLLTQDFVRGGGFRSLAEIMKGMAPGMKDRWKQIKKDPKSMPALLNRFKVNIDEAAEFGKDDEDYEEEMNNISKDKTDPEAYKLVVRKYDYRRTARK